MYIKFHWRKTMQRKVLEKQTDSCKIKFDNNFILKYIYASSVCCFAVDLLSFINILRYTAHYMTRSILWVDLYLLLRLKRNLLKIICVFLFFEFFTNHGGISAELIIITKNSILNEFPEMNVHREVNVRHKRVSVAIKTLIFAYFSAKLYQTLLEINKLNLPCIGWCQFL